MRRIRMILLLTVISVLGMVLFASQGGVANANSSGTCRIRNFQLLVRHGPTEGMLLLGTLTLSADYLGNITGSLLANDRQFVINASGTVNGYALNLAFDLGYSGRTQTYIFGSGTLSHPFPDCSGLSGGLLQGPQQGDSGTWSVMGEAN